MTTGKTIDLTIQTFVSKVMSLLFNMLSRFVIAFLPRSKCLLISWLQSQWAVILKPKKMKFFTVSIVSPSICHEVIGQDAMVLVFWMLSFKPAFSLSSFTFIKRLFSSSLLFAIRVMSSVYLKLLIFSQQSWFQSVHLPAWHFAWHHLYVESKIWHKWTYPWNRNRLTDIDNRLVVAKEEEVVEGWIGSLGSAVANHDMHDV